MKTDTPSSQDRILLERSKRTASTLILSILTALMLALIKFATGFMTHSMAIWASGLDSLMDVGVSSVNLLAAREAAKPPDEDHAYGHGKIESLAGLFQSIFIALSGVYIIVEAIKRLLGGTSLHVIPVGIGVMFFAMLVTWLLARQIQRSAQRNKSLILATERLHFTTDFLTNGGIIFALFLVQISKVAVWDLLVSILVALYIFKVSFKILRHCVDELLDRSLPPVSKEEIETIIYAHHPSIVGLHNFRGHRVGEKIFLDFHIEIHGEKDFKKAHDITESMIEKIQAHYPGADITVHYDPEGAK
jgi:ferrous-iron efflux pump FieF